MVQYTPWNMHTVLLCLLCCCSSVSSRGVMDVISYNVNWLIKDGLFHRKDARTKWPLFCWRTFSSPSAWMKSLVLWLNAPTGPIDEQLALIQEMSWNLAESKSLLKSLLTKINGPYGIITRIVVINVFTLKGIYICTNWAPKIWMCTESPCLVSLLQPFCNSAVLTACGLLMPYGARELSLHWFR